MMEAMVNIQQNRRDLQPLQPHWDNHYRDEPEYTYLDEIIFTNTELNPKTVKNIASIITPTQHYPRIMIQILVFKK